MISSPFKSLPAIGFLTFCRFASKRKVSWKILRRLDRGYEKLRKSNSKSLLKKHLKPRIYMKLRKKVGPNSTLLDCIQSGLTHHDSGCGIYAPEAAAYTIFADIFNPIIKDYHSGFDECSKQPKSFFGDPYVFKDVDPKKKYIVSTRIRCARSIQCYPFNPIMKQRHYLEIEQLLKCVLENLTHELEGKFYPLAGMNKKVQQKLIDDHYLFKEGDRFLQAGNSNRFWPKGRGIFLNNKKTFVVWCNEEDHIRIISMQPGGHFGDVYGRLVDAMYDIGKKVDFAHDKRLGFLTLCPTNLGTTIRASVHIKVPNLAYDPKKLVKVASKYKLRVRGTRGENSMVEDDIYDISNKRRLGLTEYQVAKEFYNGISNIIKLEQSLERRYSSNKSRAQDFVDKRGIKKSDMV